MQRPFPEQASGQSWLLSILSDAGTDAAKAVVAMASESGRPCGVEKGGHLDVLTKSRSTNETSDASDNLRIYIKPVATIINIATNADVDADAARWVSRLLARSLSPYSLSLS